MTRRGDWMQTFTGRQFWPLDPRASEIHIEDIAHALSMQCRYGGHSLRFYSVAEHCVLMAAYADHKNGNGLWALLHDASEAYLVDVPRPVKASLTGYAAAETLLQLRICERFGLDPVMPAEVKELDNRILLDERDQLMRRPPAPWVCDGLQPLGVKVCDGLQPLGVKVRGLEPEMAERAFLTMFDMLGGVR